MVGERRENWAAQGRAVTNGAPFGGTRARPWGVHRHLPGKVVEVPDAKELAGDEGAV